MTLLKTTWCSGYDPLVFEFLDPGSTPGVVSKIIQLLLDKKTSTHSIYHHLVHY